MELKLSHYILHIIQRAHYEYDASVKAWVGWIKGIPGIYAQGKSVKDVRNDLISTLEDSFFLDIKRGKKIPGFSITSRHYAKTH